MIVFLVGNVTLIAQKVLLCVVLTVLTISTADKQRFLSFTTQNKRQGKATSDENIKLQ